MPFKRDRLADVPESPQKRHAGRGKEADLLEPAGILPHGHPGGCEAAGRVVSDCRVSKT